MTFDRRPSHPVHAIAVLAAIALPSTLTGCALDPKTVGQESATNEGDGDGSASAEDGSESASDGPSVSVGDADGGSSNDDGGVWDDCADQVCGSFCHVCNPEDPQCAEPGTFTVCLPDGTCEAWSTFDEDPCPGTGVEPGVEAVLTQSGGCADMTVYATDRDASVALHVIVAGLVAEAQQTGAPVVREYAADDPALTLELTYGTELLAETCSDFVENPPAITELWRASPGEGVGAGTVTIEVEIVQTELGEEPRANVTLTDVNLRRMDFDGLDPDIVIDELAITDVLVGWLPG